MRSTSLSYPILSRRPLATVRLPRRSLKPLCLPVAASESAQREGLSKRTSMSPSEGMVFAFPVCDRWRFTLAQTRVPLDVIFCCTRCVIDDSTIVLDVLAVATVSAGDPRPVDPGSDRIDVVIELSAGAAREAGIVPGAELWVCACG